MTPIDRIRSDADEVLRPGVIVLAHAAADAIAELCATLDACALEVQARGGQRTARDYLMPAARGQAMSAVALLLGSLPAGSPGRTEVRDIMGAVANNYPRPWMALRVVALAAEASR